MDEAKDDGGKDAAPAGAPRSPRVFISYSHDSDEHRARVLELANRLRSEGVDAWLDRYEQAPAEGWPRWMQDQLERADFIVLVCTETYKRRFEGNEEPGKGRGVTWEGLLAAQLLYEGGTVNRMLLPVLFGNSSSEEDWVPFALRSYVRFRLPDKYEALYRLITRQPDVVAPPLGSTKPLRAAAPLRSLREPPTRSDGLPPPERDSATLDLLTAELTGLRAILSSSKTHRTPLDASPNLGAAVAYVSQLGLSDRSQFA